MTALILLAHGSRHPQTAPALAQLTLKVRAELPSASVGGPSHVVLAWLDLSAPSLDEVLASLAEEGVTDAVAVPLLFTEAFHARVDIPAQVRDAARHGVRVRVLPGLGLHDATVRSVVRRIGEVARGRQSEATIPARVGENTPGSHGEFSGDTGSSVAPSRRAFDVLVMAVGSADTEANRAVHDFALRIDRLFPGHVTAGFSVGAEAVTGKQRLVQAYEEAEANNRDLIVVPLFTAPGLLWDRVQLPLPGVHYGQPLGDLLADTLVCRWDSRAQQGTVRDATPATAA